MPSVNAIPGMFRYPPPRGLTVDSSADLTAEQQSIVDTLDSVVSALNNIDVTGSATMMESTALANNRWLLGAGRHAGIIMASPGVGAMSGVSLKSVVGGFVQCDTATKTIISGVELDGTVLDVSMLTVANGALAIVSGCSFAQSATSTISPITVESGGKLIVNNCIFTGMGTTANRVIAHSGAAANVYASYCINSTGATVFADAANVTLLGII